MSRFIVRRLLLVAMTLWVVSILVFAMSRSQGDPRSYLIQRGNTQADWDALGRELGLDKPLPVQYLVWAGNILRGNLGQSVWEARSVTDAISQRLRATSLLVGTTLVFSMVGVPLGVLSAVRRGSFWDYSGRIFALMGQALPPFWIGLVLILVFSVQFTWLPAGKMGGIKHFILPTITLGWFSAAGILRLVRSSLLSVLDEEYIKLARAKGVAGRVVIWKHAFKNAIIPPLNYVGIMLGGLLTGTVVVESVFGWPGVGRLAISAILHNDFPVVGALVLMYTLFFIGANLLVDILQAYIDPRIRYT